MPDQIQPPTIEELGALVSQAQHDRATAVRVGRALYSHLHSLQWREPAAPLWQSATLGLPIGLPIVVDVELDPWAWEPVPAVSDDCGHPNHGASDHDCAPFHEAEGWSVFQRRIDELGRVNQWGDESPVAYFPGEPITPADIERVVGNPFREGSS